MSFSWIFDLDFTEEVNVGIGEGEKSRQSGATSAAATSNRDEPGGERSAANADGEKKVITTLSKRNRGPETDLDGGQTSRNTRECTRRIGKRQKRDPECPVQQCLAKKT